MARGGGQLPVRGGLDVYYKSICSLSTDYFVYRNKKIPARGGEDQREGLVMTEIQAGKVEAMRARLDEQKVMSATAAKAIRALNTIPDMPVSARRSTPKKGNWWCRLQALFRGR